MGSCISLKGEEEFWLELQEKYLKPIPDNKERQMKIADDLRELRNKVSAENQTRTTKRHQVDGVLILSSENTQINFAFFIVNALWLVATFTLQLYSSTFAIKVPKIDMHLNVTEEIVTIEPIGFMFIMGFATSVAVQFFAMIYHR